MTNWPIQATAVPVRISLAARESKINLDRSVRRRPHKHHVPYRSCQYHSGQPVGAGCVGAAAVAAVAAFSATRGHLPALPTSGRDRLGSKPVASSAIAQEEVD